MTRPEGWPTLERIDWFRFGDPLERHEPICDAAEWAVTAYPALVALVARHAARGDWNPGLKQALDELAAILALAKEETKE